MKYEVFLKKVYYLLHGEEAQPREGRDHVTLADLIFLFPCLRDLRHSHEEKYRTLSGYLDKIRSQRNTSSGNGAHFSMFYSDDELDEDIKEVVTMYMYVIGMCYDELATKCNL